MLSPDGRVVMIAGASRGIGRALAERLLQSGFTVSAGVRRPADLPVHDRLSAHAWDAGIAETADRWVAETFALRGRIDAVVNVAGIMIPATLLDFDETNLDTMWTVNTKAPMRVIRAAWPHLVACGEGRVINISSLSGKRVRNDNLGYAMSKFAMMALTQEVRRRGWDLGIRACTVCPGFVATDMTAGIDRFPREKMSSPDDVAAMIESVLRLPNTATVAELLINCRHEDTL